VRHSDIAAIGASVYSCKARGLRVYRLTAFTRGAERLVWISRPVETMASRFSVLVVDDNRDVADSTATLVRASGFAARVAYGGRQALELARNEPPDCVVLDVDMPDVDGHAVVRAMRADPATAHAKFIAHTAYSTGRQADLIRQSGFDYHLVKGAADYAQLEEILNMLKEIKKLAEQTQRTAEQSAELVGETRGLLREAKAEFRDARGDLREVKGEIKEVKEELKEVKEELKEVKEDLRDTKRPNGGK
jgi:two-component system, OmpR family, response regulator